MFDERMDPLDHLDPDLNHFQAINNFLSMNCSNYHNTNKFNSMFQPNSLNLNIIHINIRSINQNGNNLVVFLSNLNVTFDIICISETWLAKGSVLVDLLPNYNAFKRILYGNTRKDM